MMDTDGWEGESVVLRLQAAVEAKRAGLLGPSLLHHLTGARQALFATPSCRCVETVNSVFPCT